MSRLHEHQGKALLHRFGIPVPRGHVADSPAAARARTAELGAPVVVKAQVWMTGRAAIGGVLFASTSDEAERAAAALLGRAVGRFTIDEVLVEERLDIERELYAAVTIDDRARAPSILLGARGGSGVEANGEGIVRRTIDVRRGFDTVQARALAERAGIDGAPAAALTDLLPHLYRAARDSDALTLEINPLVWTDGGALIAADCRVTIDDNAVYRQPDLGIDVAREFDHPITRLERMAWGVERDDYRGTFYFVQLAGGEPVAPNRGALVGFHGSGGGGAMLAMDALQARGLRPADFVDTSGNPPASKVYRAARLILEQPDLEGYFASGSGVASQEQYLSARGMAKAFLDVPLRVPAVVRLGGNGEERALAILGRVAERLGIPVEGYGKDDPVEGCAERLRELIEDRRDDLSIRTEPTRREPPAATLPYRFETVSGGAVTLDHAVCATCTSKVCIDSCAPGILMLDGEVPVLRIGRDEAERGGCSECLGCDVDCYLEGSGGGFVSLPIAGLDDGAFGA